MDTIKAEMDGDKAQAAIEQAMSALDAEGGRNVRYSRRSEG